MTPQARDQRHARLCLVALVVVVAVVCAGRLLIPALTGLVVK